jgi:hypothetical protein
VKTLWLTILALILGFATQAQTVLFAKSAAFRAFNPATYDANVGQWCAARFQSFANSDPVGTYTDSSGNARNFTASGSARPTFTTSAVNGLPALDFDGSDDWMSAGDVLDMGTGGLTIMMVFKMDSTGGVKTQLAKSFAGDATGRYYFSHVSGNTDSVLDAGASNLSVSYADTSTSWQLVTIVFERGVSLRIYKNGTLQDSDTLSDNTTNFNTTYALLLGAYNNGTDGLGPDPGSYFDGLIAEHVIWSAALGTSSREGAEDSLGTLYGITITH